MNSKFDVLLHRLREADSSSAPSSGVSSVNGMTGAVILPLVAPSASMPAASASNAGDVVLYTGASGLDYTEGHTYICREASGIYSWVDVTPSSQSYGLTRWDPSGWTAVTRDTLYKASVDGWLKIVRTDSLQIAAQVTVLFTDTDLSTFSRIVLPAVTSAESRSCEFMPVWAGMEYKWIGGQGQPEDAKVYFSPAI